MQTEPRILSVVDGGQLRAGGAVRPGSVRSIRPPAGRAQVPPEPRLRPATADVRLEGQCQGKDKYRR